MWVVTVEKSPFKIEKIISIHTTHVGGDVRGTIVKSVTKTISIHTTHVGGDVVPSSVVSPLSTISIHTTHVGGDKLKGQINEIEDLFQSTPPMWVVTVLTCHTVSIWHYFNPHHPCGW